MKIQLFFENQEVELNDKVSFPLNKSFENLWNPTDIIVEYSKSIKIPATAANNKLMMNAYRIDRQFAVNDNAANIGMNLDPLKRIPMKLIYNGNIMLDGYAKYISSTVNAKQTYYTFNLYGVLGDIFQTLLDCVVDENKLTEEQKAESDGGAKYVIPCPWEPMLINKDFVKRSWEESEPNITYNYWPFNCIGMAPAYRGLYSDFESTSALGLTWNGAILGRPTESTSVEDDLKQQWKINLVNAGRTEESAQQRVDALDFNMILPIGISEHQLRQFRSYEQKPYIYIRSLIDMYRNKCQELTGYTINLDPDWFNVNNPYYLNLCYMLDYLSTRGINTENTSKLTDGARGGTFSSTAVQNTLKWFGYNTTYTDFPVEISELGIVKTKPFDLGIKVVKTASDNDPLWTGKGNIYDTYVGISPLAHVTVDVTFTNSSGESKVFRHWGAENQQNVTPIMPSYYDGSNFKNTYVEVQIDKTTSPATINSVTYLPIKSMDLGAFNTDGLKMTVALRIWHPQSGDNLSSYYYAFLYRHRNPLKGSTTYSGLACQTDNNNFTVVVPEIEVYSNWRYTTTCELKSLYTKDEPLFNVILQYTKMFGLIWKADYHNKTIDIMTRKTYFKDYNIVDWTDKIDKSKGLTIEPVSFSSKYVKFNYKEIDGYRYSGYKKKYGVNYGEKKIRTKYNFDTKETNLLNNTTINPSSMSCKSFYDIDALYSWDTLSKLPLSTSDINFIDCENDASDTSIQMNNWYFRCSNKQVDKTYYITDASSAEISDGKYYWLGNNMLDMYGCGITVNELPQFSTVYKNNSTGEIVGCLYNCPNEDYTYDNQVADAKGKYIYDLCWEDYINERYNANNKKVTAYVRLLPHEFEQFNFKTFVVIDNQLFIVNKIFDFDVNSQTTKVEFIQVTNIDGYISQRYNFPVLLVSKSAIDIYPTMTDWGASGSASVTVKTINDFDWDIVPIEADTTKSRCWVEDAETDGYETSLYITYESDEPHDEKWEMHIIYEGEIVKRIPITI